MKAFVRASLLSAPILTIAFTAPPTVVCAQESSAAGPPPKVLVIIREVLKPSTTASAHQKSESAFVQAFKDAKWPTHYLAISSVSGPPRTLFLEGYDSFAAWGKDQSAQQKNDSLTSAVDKATVADADLLTETTTAVLAYREDLSVHPNLDICKMRLMEVSVFRVKAGHRKDWEDLVKLYQNGFDKIPNAHAVVYETAYGLESGGRYLVFSPMASAAEIDQGMLDGKQFAANVGADGMKKISELTAAAIDSTQSNLFTFDPKMSYASDRCMQEDAAFWKP